MPIILYLFYPYFHKSCTIYKLFSFVLLLVIPHTTIKKMYFTKNLIAYAQGGYFRGYWICYLVKILLFNNTKFSLRNLIDASGNFTDS